MRRFHRIAPLVAAMLVTAPGCTDLLIEDPKSFTTTDTFYRTAGDINAAVIATYSAIRGIQGFGNWPNLELASDQARADNREPNAGTRSGDHLDWDASTGQTGGYWGMFYAAITRANLVLTRGAEIQVSNQQAKTWNLAEAKFLRAYSYMFLTKVYDDVPLLLTPEEQASNPQPTRTPVEQIHQAVIKDLTEAEAELPERWPQTDAFNNPTQGRVTKGTARMALADLYIWRSSFMGKNEWTQAAAAAKRIIDSGIWRLNDDYIRTFLPVNRGNAEMIFVITNTGKEGRTSSPWQLFYHPRDWGIDIWGGWGLIHPTDWFYNSYPAGDYRKEAGFLTGGCSGGGLCITTFGDGPMPYKYRKSDNGASWPLGDVDAPLYRYAETLLYYAEAQNELGNTADAVTHLNLVRARARKGTGAENRASPANYSGPMDKLAVREAIYMERLWELSHEAKRWFDQVRRDTMEPGYWMNSLRNDPSASRLRPISTHKKRFPIPAAQILANPKLTQNPGY